jgi:HSP20 family molecular chaperone IbpA
MNQAREMTPTEETPVERREGPPVRPPVDICETGEALTIWADMPGVSRENLAVGVEGDTLTIEGAASIDIPENTRSVYAELRTAHYRRSFSLSSELDTGNIKAAIKNGVLTLRIPKREEQKPRKIEVQVG